MAEVEAGHYVEAVAAALEEVLREALVGIYVHGSLALGGFVPERSDVDMLVLTSRSLTNQEKQEVANRTSQASLPCPGLGLELSVVTVEGIRDPSKRVPFEVHVDTKSGRTVDGAAHHGDSDLALHFAVCRAAGIALRGPHPRQVFPEVPRSWLLEGFAAELAWAEEHADWGNGFLNACRNWRYLEEGKIGSKLEGAAWASEQVTDPSAIDQAAAWKGGLRPDPPSPEIARSFMALVRERLAGAVTASGD
jgi:hypothetical protein